MLRSRTAEPQVAVPDYCDSVAVPVDPSVVLTLASFFP